MNPKHIHIVGCLPRSGTTLMIEVMLNCFDIDGFVGNECSIFQEYPYPYNVLCTKNPNDIKRVEYPLSINKDLYVIYMQRDPRDAISSRSNANNSQNKKIWGNLKSWLQHQKIAENLHHSSRFIVIRYEDLVSEPDKTQQYLLERLPFLQVKAKFSEYHLTAEPSAKSVAALGYGGVRPISPVSIGTWRKNMPYLKAQLEKYGDISQRLIDLQYEPDSSWLSELEDVIADNSEEPVKKQSSWAKWRDKNLKQPRRRLLYRLSCSPRIGKYVVRLRSLLRKISF